MPRTRMPFWGTALAGLFGLTTVAVAEPSAAGPEVLEIAGAAGPPWWRLRALWLGLVEGLPLGTPALRFGLAVALLHGLLAALVASATTRALHRPDDRMNALAAPAGALAGALAVVSAPALAAVALPSAAALGVVVLLLGERDADDGELASFFAGLTLAVEPLLFPFAALRLARALRWRRPSRRASLAFAAGAAPLLLWFAPGRALYTFPLSLAEPSISLAEAWASLRQLGGVSLGLALVGAVLAAREALRDRSQRASLEVASEWLVALVLWLLAGPLLGSALLLLFTAHSARLAACAVWRGGAVLAQRRVPFARTTVALLFVLLCAIPAARLDTSIARPNQRRLARAAADLQMFARLPDDAIVLARDRDGERALLAAQLLSVVPATVDVLPLRDITSVRAHEAILRDPTLAPIVRETMLDDLPSEYVLSNLAGLRPLLIEVPPSVPKPIAKHLLPLGVWFRFDAEPRAASDRASALDRQKRVREATEANLAAAPAVRARVLRASRRLALALAATGEKESASRGVDQLRAIAGDEPLVSLLLRMSVLGASKQEIEELVHEE